MKRRFGMPLIYLSLAAAFGISAYWVLLFYVFHAWQAGFSGIHQQRHVFFANCGLAMLFCCILAIFVFVVMAVRAFFAPRAMTGFPVQMTNADHAQPSDGVRHPGCGNGDSDAGGG